MIQILVILIIMTLKHFDFSQKGFSYETPSVSILDVQVEGMLCESGISINDWENDEELLDFD